MKFCISVNKIKIRLPDERWLHIIENHNDLAGLYYEVLECVNNPDYLVLGNENELFALKKINNRKYLAVIYKEDVKIKDGFIITAFLTSQYKKILKRRILWQRPKQ